MWVNRTPEELIWGYPETLLEAAKLIDDSLPMNKFGFFTKVSLYCITPPANSPAPRISRPRK